MAKVAFFGIGLALSAAAGAVAAEPLPEVMSVLAPGQGGNLRTETEARNLPAVFSSQVAMYKALARDVDDLIDADLPRYYKSSDLDDVPTSQIASEISPRRGVRIVRDKLFGVPHVRGRTREDAIFGIGYARAQDRLWQMDVNRHEWRASKAAFLGPGADGENLKSDNFRFIQVDYSEREYRSMFDGLARRYGARGRQVQRDLTAYCEGINAFIAEARKDPALLPLEYRRRKLKPEPWRVTDELAAQATFHSLRKLGGEIGNARLLLQLQERLGPGAGRAVYNDLRNGANPRAPVVIADRRFGGSPATDDPRAISLPDPGSFQPRLPVTIRTAGATAAPAAGPLLRWGIVPAREKSNALLISGRLSKTGHPISVQGPQDGYGTPNQFDWEVQVIAPDFEARGVLEWSGPYPYNGVRGRNYAFSGTAQYSDQADTFVELLCEPNGRAPTRTSRYYRYRGRCVPFSSRIDKVAASDGSRAFERRSERSVHGSVLGRATVGGRPVALTLARATYRHEERDLVTQSQLFSPSIIRSGADFVRVARNGSQDLGFFYIDRKDIAYVLPALTPVRHAGTSGDLPIWGSGQWDWRGFDPATFRYEEVRPEQRPQVVNPASGMLIGWNNQPALGWKILESKWDVNEFHRVRLLAEPMIAAAKPLAVSDIVRIHERAALTDANAGIVYPAIRLVLGTIVEDKMLEDVLRRMDDWIARGARRQDRDDDGFVDDGAQVALYDTWMPLALRAVLTPVLGQDILDDADKGENNLPPVSFRPAWTSGWSAILDRDLRGLGGKGRRPLPHPFCGSGDAAACRRDLLSSLREAVRLVRSKQGSDPARWRTPSICEGDCLQNSFPATGEAVPIKPIPWQNRPTNELVVSFR